MFQGLKSVYIASTEANKHTHIYMHVKRMKILSLTSLS